MTLIKLKKIFIEIPQLYKDYVITGSICNLMQIHAKSLTLVSHILVLVFSAETFPKNLIFIVNFTIN